MFSNFKINRKQKTSQNEKLEKFNVKKVESLKSYVMVRKYYF